MSATVIRLQLFALHLLALSPAPCCGAAELRLAAIFPQPHGFATGPAGARLGLGRGGSGRCLVTLGGARAEAVAGRRRTLAGGNGRALAGLVCHRETALVVTGGSRGASAAGRRCWSANCPAGPRASYAMDFDVGRHRPATEESAKAGDPAMRLFARRKEDRRRATARSARALGRCALRGAQPDALRP